MSKTLQLVMGSSTIDFSDWADHGLIIGSVDLGFPAPREVVTNLPGRDGDFDETAFFGTRVVTLTGSAGPGADGSRAQGLALLAPFLAPGARPQLVFALSDDVAERVLNLRPSDFTAPVADGTAVAFTASWKCPDPIAYGLVTNETDIPPSTGATGGRTYSRTFPQVYPASFGGAGQATVITNGNYATWPVLRIYGPCVDPAVYWLDAGANRIGTQVVFAGLTIVTGDYIEVNTRAQTVTLNGSPGANRYSFLDFANTQFGPLRAGSNLLQFAASSASAPAEVAVLFPDAYLI